ncbi:hypothetical protein SAMN05444671_4551 [Flavobacterium sp. CF108]|jgi:hypothetical protein|uniref:hypothetical protein n=1 Tax=unclassified Flavobacterium TaxID=196869 RepID=UPI0008C251F8|nr:MULTISPECIES: hypothetical protein [unclassified Flavobacterium]SEP03842.1 hypothetical protein SAMN04487978_4267 [Flavobacterium sp. fv08]SHH97704.1 hypothetical protein SAMN05444671_4551 [Flavobacterium sp. CF108]
MIPVLRSSLNNQSVMDKISVDCVVFCYDEGDFKVLLVKQDKGIGRVNWGLLSSIVTNTNNTDDIVHGLLKKLNIHSTILFKQIHCSISYNMFEVRLRYYVLIDSKHYRINFASDVPVPRWFKLNDVPDLIDNHNAALDFCLYDLKRFMEKKI